MIILELHERMPKKSTEHWQPWNVDWTMKRAKWNITSWVLTKWTSIGWVLDLVIPSDSGFLKFFKISSGVVAKYQNKVGVSFRFLRNFKESVGFLLSSKSSQKNQSVQEPSLTGSLSFPVIISSSFSQNCCWSGFHILELTCRFFLWNKSKQPNLGADQYWVRVDQKLIHVNAGHIVKRNGNLKQTWNSEATLQKWKPEVDLKLSSCLKVYFRFPFLQCCFWISSLLQVSISF
jgi:hypothetical protein